MSDGKNLIDIKSMDRAELTAFITQELSEPRFRAAQLFEWMHVKLADDFDSMTNLPKALRAKLQETCCLRGVHTVRRLISREDGTRKYLFALDDGNVIESVLMKYKYGYSVCVSSQAGCRMGCRFCASTLNGLARNLTASEMLDEVYAIRRDLGERISHVVIMGSGEPLDNYDSVVRFIRLLADEKGQHISQRNITLSTCGIVPGILKLADEDLAITLAISLHASSDERRRALMPIAAKYPIEELLAACRSYYGHKNRRMTMEYSLVKGVNDSAQDARELARLLQGMPVHINLIPINPIKERNYRQSEDVAVMRFKNILENCGEHVTIRREMGRDIQAACGQLRKSYMDEQSGKRGSE